MKKQYVLTEAEIRGALERLKELRIVSLLCRDVGDEEANREFYLKAKGFEDALRILGIIKQ